MAESTVSTAYTTGKYGSFKSTFLKVIVQTLKVNKGKKDIRYDGFKLKPGDQLLFLDNKTEGLSRKILVGSDVRIDVRSKDVVVLEPDGRVEVVKFG